MATRVAKPPKAGDKCPRCREGMVIRTELGLACDECPWELELDALVKQDQEYRKGQKGEFKPRTFKITIDDPEEAENFLRGLIVARTNNSSEYFVDLIEAVNTIMEPWREQKLEEEMHARAAAGMR